MLKSALWSELESGACSSNCIMCVAVVIEVG